MNTQAPGSAVAADEANTDQTQSHADCGMEGHAAHGYIGNKTAYLSRLKRIEGQTRGLQRMVDEEKYCIDILTQISAINSALKSVAMGLLEEHLSHCVVQAAVAGGDEAQDKITEATQAINRLVKS